MVVESGPLPLSSPEPTAMAMAPWAQWSVGAMFPRPRLPRASLGLDDLRFFGSLSPLQVTHKLTIERLDPFQLEIVLRVLSLGAYSRSGSQWHWRSTEIGAVGWGRSDDATQ